MNRPLAIIFVLIFPLVTTGLADWVTEDGHKMHFPQYPNTAGWDVKGSIPVVLADDWQCAETGWVKDIHWWGSWRNGVEGQIDGFILSIHENIPGDPGDPACYARPGAALWEYLALDFLIAEPYEPPELQGWYDPSTGEIVADDHTAYFQYNVFLPETDWFLQEAGTIYWLNVMAIVDDPDNTAWGLKSTSDHWGSDAVFASGPGFNWFHMYEPGGWPPYVPGDVDGDCDVDSDDLDYLVAFIGGGPPPPLVVEYVGPFYPAADANGNCQVNNLDVVYLINYLNQGGPAPIFCFEFPVEGSGVSLDLAFVINGGAAENVPALSEWAMLILGLLLVAVGTAAIVRRKGAEVRESA